MTGTPAMVLCAGLGTRLRPLTDWLAKPMVPVGDAPAVAHVVARVRAAGASPIALNVHHRPGDVRAWAEREGIFVSVEDELLGTAGGIARARSLLGDGDVLVWNGDILSDLDAAVLVATAAGAAATLAVVTRAAGTGNVGLDAEGRIVRLRRESVAEETLSADFVGVHVIGARLRAILPETGCVVGDVYIPALRRGERLVARVVGESFFDVGSVAAYMAANRAWLSSRGLASWAAPDALVSAPIEGSVIGAGARIDAPATRSVVWPGTRLREPIEDAVATPFGVVSAL